MKKLKHLEWQAQIHNWYNFTPFTLPMEGSVGKQCSDFRNFNMSCLVVVGF